MSNDTKYVDLQSTIKAVGKKVFVDFYYDFKNTNMPFEKLRDKLYTENPNAKSRQQRFRISRAWHIFQTGQEIAALEDIIASKKLEPSVVNRAKQILDDEKLSKMLQDDRVSEQVFIEEVDREIVYTEGTDFNYDNTPRAPREQIQLSVGHYPRSRIVAKNALLKAKCLCEVDNNHPVFKRKNSNLNYTEPHHIIPLSAFMDFPNVDLDREQNVVSLCSHCHNLLHYGSEFDIVLKSIYEQRKDLLKLIGIDITYEALKKYYK